MKKIIIIVSLALVMALALSLLMPVLANSGNRTVSFSLSLRQNWIWALYGLDVYIDGTYAMTMEQGDIAYFNAVVTGGWHTIEFRGGGSYSGNTKKIYLGNLNDGTAISLCLQTHEAYIEAGSFTVNGDTQSVTNPDTLADTAETAGKLLSIVSLF